MAEGTRGLKALSLADDGAERCGGAAVLLLPELAELFVSLRQTPGHRLTRVGNFAHHLETSGAIGKIAARHVGPNARPVRAIAFDKTPEINWALGWHQDRTICVTEKVNVAGYGPWTIKQGLHHVAPPIDLLSSMVTLRVHLDPVDSANAPLRIAPGTHRFGLVSEQEIPSIIEQIDAIDCLAEAGDVWIYSTPILHASDRANGNRQRRVLQIDYSAERLPEPLEWLGIR